MWAAVFLLAAGAGARVGGAALPGWAAVGRAAAVLPVLLAGAGRRRRALAWCAVAAAAAWWGQGAAADRRAAPPARAPAPMAPAVVCGWAGPLALRTSGYAAALPRDRWRAPARILACGSGSGDAPPRRGQGVWLRGEGPVPPPGAILTARCELARPGPAVVPGGFDLRQFLAGRGLAWSGQTLGPAVADTSGGDPVARLGRFAARGRAAGAATLTTLLPPREARLASAVLLGWRTAASRSETADFTALGLAHLFAVSGLHVGILAGLLLLPAAALGAGRGGAGCPAGGRCAGVRGADRGSRLGGAGRQRGGPGRGGARLRPPGGRAAPAGPGVLGDRRLGPGHGAGQRGAAVVSGGRGHRPGQRPDRRFPVRGAGGPLRAVVAGLGVSLSAQWATLPVVAGAFGRINGWSPLVNVAAVPVFGVAVWLLAGAVVLAPVWGWAAAAVAAWGWLLMRGLEAGAAGVAGPAGAAELGIVPPGPDAVAAWLGATVVLAGILRAPGRIRFRAPLAVAVALAGLGLMGPAGRLLPPRGGPRGGPVRRGPGRLRAGGLPRRLDRADRPGRRLAG